MNIHKELIGAMLLVVVLLGVVIAAAIHQDKEWKKFVVTNECKVIAQVAGRYHTGTIHNKDGTTSRYSEWEPARVTWRCADGVTYTR
jgi:hypothetical protein